MFLLILIQKEYAFSETNVNKKLEARVFDVYRRLRQPCYLAFPGFRQISPDDVRNAKVPHDTGTPINRIDKNTFRTFGAMEDKSGDLSRYTFSDCVRDNATLPLKFESVPVDLHVDKEKLDEEFEALTENLSDADRAELSKRVNMKAIMYDPKRNTFITSHKIDVHAF